MADLPLKRGHGGNRSFAALNGERWLWDKVYVKSNYPLGLAHVVASLRSSRVSWASQEETGCFKVRFTFCLGSFALSLLVRTFCPDWYISRTMDCHEKVRTSISDAQKPMSWPFSLLPPEDNIGWTMEDGLCCSIFFPYYLLYTIACQPSSIHCHQSTSRVHSH